MQSLCQLLGSDHADAPSAARTSRHDGRERLALADVVATSILYLCPGAWLQTESCWSSDKILLLPRAANDGLVALTQSTSRGRKGLIKSILKAYLVPPLPGRAGRRHHAPRDCHSCQVPCAAQDGRA